MPLTSYSKPLKIHQRQPARTKHSPSFSDIPPEIILNVFKSSNNFSAATTLSSVSRQFNTMWKLNISSISKAILGHMFEAHEEGLALVTALEAASDELFDNETLDPIKRPADQDTVSEAIARIEHFISNAKVALLVLNFNEEYVFPFDTDQSLRLNTEERVHFFKSYYLMFIHAIHDNAKLPATLSRNPDRAFILATWGLGLRKMILYLRLDNNQSGQLPKGLLPHCQYPARLKSLTSCDTLGMLHRTLLEFVFKLLDLDSDICWHRKPWTPFYLLFVFDGACADIACTRQHEVWEEQLFEWAKYATLCHQCR